MTGLTKPSHQFKVNREAENIVLLSRDLASRSEAWCSRPTEIEFSFNNLCNLKCIMCGKADGETNTVMDRDLGIRVLDEILPCALHLTPAANSEPFLNDMGLLYDMCEKHDVSLFIFTNGALCNEERFSRIQKRVHKLWFSFDSHEKATFEKIRAGASYETVLKNIRKTLELAEKDETEITFHFVLMRINLLQLPDYVRFIAEIGGKQVQVQELLPNSLAFQELAIKGGFSDEKVSEVLERTKDEARQAGIDLVLALRRPFAAEVRSLPMRTRSKAPSAALREMYMESFLRVYPYFCNMASNYLKITPQGDVFPCCRAPEVLKMGNVSDAPIEEIWNNDHYRSFRKGMFDREYHKECLGCSVLTGNPYFKL